MIDDFGSGSNTSWYDQYSMVLYTLYINPANSSAKMTSDKWVNLGREMQID